MYQSRPSVGSVPAHLLIDLVELGVAPPDLPQQPVDGRVQPRVGFMAVVVQELDLESTAFRVRDSDDRIFTESEYEPPASLHIALDSRRSLTVRGSTPNFATL